MDYRKVDAALAIALSEDEDGQDVIFDVFIHMARPIDETMSRALHKMSIPGGTIGHSIITAALDRHQIEQLTDLPEIEALRLTRPLRFSRLNG